MPLHIYIRKLTISISVQLLSNYLKFSSNSACTEFIFHSTNQAGLETGGWRAGGFKPEELGTHSAPC